MHTKTYSIIIDHDLESLDLSNLHELMFSLLNSPIGWGKYYMFIPVSHDANILIHISSPDTLHRITGRSDLSCAELNGNVIHFNVYRWLYGSPISQLNLHDYRQYMVTHEMGHIFGLKHVPIPKSGLAPIMIQQTLGIGNCIPNCELFL